MSINVNNKKIKITDLDDNYKEKRKRARYFVISSNFFKSIKYKYKERLKEMFNLFKNKKPLSVMVGLGISAAVCVGVVKTYNYVNDVFNSKDVPVGSFRAVDIDELEKHGGIYSIVEIDDNTVQINLKPNIRYVGYSVVRIDSGVFSQHKNFHQVWIESKDIEDKANYVPSRHYVFDPELNTNYIIVEHKDSEQTKDE